MEQEKYTKYEKARILGSRALQISMGAPFLVKLDEKDLENLNYDSLAIAKEEFKEGIVPITVRRPLPVIEQEEKQKQASSVEKKEEAA